MDYKKIIKSRAVRGKILRLLSFVPDEPMLKLQYWIKTGRKLDLKNPQRFTEKLQWYKLYYRDPLMAQCVDKYDVREYVKDIGLEEILIPCYGVYDRVEDIDWDALPDQFVMKDTLGGGGNSVVIVTDKKTANISQLQETAKKWTEINAHVRGGGREWPYYSGKAHRILFEAYLDSDPAQGGLIDYKFFCFNGKAEYLYVIADRRLGQGGKISIMTREFQDTGVIRIGDEPGEEKPKRPGNYMEMLETAEKLASEFPHVRVDIYNHNGMIRFGELTFFNASGYMEYDPDEFDFKLGEMLKITKFIGGG